MSLELIILPEAAREIDQAVAWYEEQTTAGAALLAAIREVFRSIAEQPLLYAVVYHDVRRASTRRFPYNVIYRVDDQRVVVIAVVHNRRNPAVWQRRV